MAGSEDAAMTNIDAGTAISIEMSNAIPQQLLMVAAARRRKQQQQQDGVLAGRKRSFTATTNAFGDSEDEAEGGEDEEGDGDEDDTPFSEDAEVVGASSGITSGGVLDLFKLRQTKRHNVV